MTEPLTILGIETSCDETAAAVVRRNGAGQRGEILSNVVFSQIEEHAPFGGVVPEIAARAHVEHLDGLIERLGSPVVLKAPDGAPQACKRSSHWFSRS